MKNIFYMLPVILLFSLGSCGRANTDVDERPNIILILADDLGWSDLGCYGSEVPTPNIDRLAEEGIRFTRFYNTSKCFPSRACLLTGIYAQQNGYNIKYTGPLANAVTLGEVLRSAGYRTLFSGKHHGLENPFDRGFDRYYGLKEGACNHFNPGLQRPGEPAPARKGRKRPWCIDSVMIEPFTPEEKDFYTTDYFTKHALEWLEEYKDEERPFFLYLAYTSPHDPLMAWPEDIRKYLGKYDQGYDAIRSARYERQKEMGLINEWHRLSEATHRNWNELDEETREFEARKMEIYAAMIDRMDQNVGKLIRKLEETGMDRNTLIMFASDNGASPEIVDLDTDDDSAEMGTMARWLSLGPDWANVGNTPFRYYKNYSFEGGINTPMIAWWPGQIKADDLTDYPGHFIDFMPTVAEISGAEYPEEFRGEPVTPMQGQSLLPVFRGEETQRKNPLYWEWKGGQALREGKWKLVRLAPDLEWELYDMESDPSETENLSGRHPERVSRMDSLYRDWHSKYYPYI